MIERCSQWQKWSNYAAAERSRLMEDRVVVFKPRAGQAAEDNLRDFITLSRESLTAFGSELVFDADSWDVTSFVRLKRRNSCSSIRFHGFSNGRGQKDSCCLPQPYKDFAKAYCRYDYALCAHTTVSSRLAALRSLAVAPEETESCVTPIKASLGHFNRACAILNERHQASAAFFAGVELKRISQFLVEHQLCTASLQWQNPLRAPVNFERRVGPEFDASCQARLPSSASLEAIAEIFGATEKPGDIFTSSVCAGSSIQKQINNCMDCVGDLQKVGRHKSNGWCNPWPVLLARR
jgi:hypothetical protein